MQIPNTGGFIMTYVYIVRKKIGRLVYGCFTSWELADSYIRAYDPDEEDMEILDMPVIGKF